MDVVIVIYTNNVALFLKLYLFLINHSEQVS
jgi:hypothetical protein